MNAAVENLVYRAENITTNNLVEFEVCLSKAETGATAYSIPDTDYTINHLEWEKHCITLNEQMVCKKEFSIHVIVLKPWWQLIDIEGLQKTIK